MKKSITKTIYFTIFIVAFLFIDYQFLSDTEWIHNGETIFGFVVLNLMLILIIYALVYEIREVIKQNKKRAKNKKEKKTTLLFFSLVTVIIAIIFVIFIIVK